MFPGATKRARNRQRKQPRSGSHAWEASNLRASQCCSCASQFDPHRCAAGKTRRSSPPIADRDQKHLIVSAATQANTRDLAKWHVDHAAHSQPVLCSTYCFPWEWVSADLEANIQPLLDDFSSFMLNSFPKKWNARLLLNYCPECERDRGLSQHGVCMRRKWMSCFSLTY